MKYRYIASPVGQLLLAGHADVLEIIGLPEGKGVVCPGEDWVDDDLVFVKAENQLNEYFLGERQEFDLKLRPSGTPFQLSVLAALRLIPYGETVAYKDIAQSIGRSRAVRAVGAANARNPLPIVIPCHRVIGSDGSLTGFRGGLMAKSFLLGLEEVLSNHAFL